MSKDLEEKTRTERARENQSPLGIKREPLLIPVCDECGGYLKHGFRIHTVQCSNCGKVWEDECIMQDFRS